MHTKKLKVEWVTQPLKPKKKGQVTLEIKNLRAKASLGGNNRKVTPWFLWVPLNFENHKKHLDKYFHNIFNEYNYLVS